MKLLLAVVVFSVLSLFGTPSSTRGGRAERRLPAQAAGLRPGDRSPAVDGAARLHLDEMAQGDLLVGGGAGALALDPSGAESLSVRVTPTRRKVQNLLGESEEKPMIGIAALGRTPSSSRPPSGWRPGWASRRPAAGLRMTVEVLGRMVHGPREPRTLGGPIAIAKMAGGQRRKPAS